MLHGLYIISLKSYTASAKAYWERISKAMEYQPELFVPFCDWFFTYTLNKLLEENGYSGNAPHHQRFIKSDWYELFPRTTDLKDIRFHLEIILRDSLSSHLPILLRSKEINTMYLGDAVVVGRLE